MAQSKLDIEQPALLLQYLRERGQIGPEETPTFRVLEGGVSNRTVWVGRPSGEAWVIKQALERLRVPTEWLSSPRRIHREAAGLRYLEQLAPPGAIPAFKFEDKEHHCLAMAAVPQPHHNWKTLLLAEGPRPAHVEQFGRLLGTVHRRAHGRRAELAEVFEDRSFFENLRLDPYYRYTASRVPAAAPFLTELVSATRQRRFTLVHGDYSPKNILIYGEQMVWLDHEVIHWGDGAFDLGFALAHLLSKAHYLVAHRPAFARAALGFWRSYSDTLGKAPWARHLESFAVRHALGCLLARVEGRSTLEYLSPDHKLRQREAVLALLPKPPAGVTTLTESFLERL